MKGTIITGINQSESIVSSKAQNRHLRIFEIINTPGNPPKIAIKLQKQVFSPSIPFNTDHYQRLTKFSKSENLLGVTSTSGDLAVLSYPSLEVVYSVKVDGDVYSIDFSPADNDTVRPPFLSLKLGVRADDG